MKEYREEKYLTELDVIGIYHATQEALEKLEGGFGALRNRVIPGKMSLESFEDIVRKDKEREKDGFPRKIRFRRVLAGPGKVITVPYVDEEHLVHGQFEPKNMEMNTARSMQLPSDPDLGEVPGAGKGEVGDVLGEQPIGQGDGDGEDGDGDGTDPGDRAGDKSGDHLEEEAYTLGKRLSEELKLPNLKEKVKKFPTDEYTYDLTDRHRGSGQVLDKKETLKRVIKTNLALKRITKNRPDPKKMIIGPEQRVYRVLSRERVLKSQAVVFFARDYSGSMWGEPTLALTSQHLMIYAWLLVQYERRVIPRFFVHDVEAREVTAKRYFGMSSGGGTYIPSVYKEITKTVRGEGLESYNIYVFQGTDGDDGDGEGEEAIPELRKILSYVNRMGVTLFKHPYYKDQKTIFEEYIEKSGIANMKDVFRMHIMPSYYDVTYEMNIEALKALIAQD
ncbi:MAG: DUF444 family protein [bacterium]|nr:DUF444 family protein [bacterium]